MRHEHSAKVVSSFSEGYVSTMSSQHIWEVLVHLLHVTMRIYVEVTSVMDDILFVILGSISDQRRKIGITDSKTCLNKSYHALFVSHEEAFRITLRELGIERGVFQWFVDNFLSDYYIPTIKDSSIERFELKRFIEDMYALYLEFRRKVLSRFEKLIDSQSSTDTWSRARMGLNTSVQDTINNYTLAVIRSIDKFHPKQGTLAGYVNPWLKNAGSSKYTMYDGEAFSISRPIRRKVHEGDLLINNKSHSLELAENLPDDSLAVSEETDSLRQMFQAIRSIPAGSLIMALYNYPVSFSLSEIEKLQTLNIGTDFEVNDEIEELAPLMPLMRASRKQTQQSERRKQMISLEKRK